MRQICFAVLLSFLMGADVSAAACNANNNFTDYLSEWLGSSAQVRDRTRQRFVAAHNATMPHLDNIIADYKAYFGDRAAPVWEISQCDTVQVMTHLNTVLNRFAR